MPVADRATPEAFVIGPIGDEDGEIGSPGRVMYEKAVEILEKVIEPACRAVGLRAIRADDITVPGEINDQVIRKLRDSDVVIADLTDANPNVMYELGLRHSIAAVTIPIAERRDDGLPFDVRMTRTVLFKRTPHGLVEARERLESMLRTALDDGEWDHVAATRIWLQDDAPGEDYIDGNDQGMPDVDDEPPGTVDLLYEMEEAQPRFIQAVEELGEVIREIGQVNSDSTERVKESDARGGGAKGRMAVLTEYTRSLDPLVVRADTLSRTIESEHASVERGVELMLSRLETREEDPDSEAAVGVLQALRSLGEASAVDPTKAMRDALDGIENLSRIVRPKVRLLRFSLDRVIEVFEAIREWGHRARELLPDEEE